MNLGIICEYNPLHSGHVYQLRRARELGATCVIAVMSGNFTQRGEFAILDKYARAEMALCAGADLVLELPYPYSASSAEFFAGTGIDILDALGADAVCFGSETGDEALLMRAAEVALSDAFRAEFEEAGRSGIGSAAAYFGLLGKHMGKESFGSNDVLGIEYCKALKRLGSAVKPLVIRREGAAYLDDSPPDAEGIHPSATALRAIVAAAEATCDAAERYAATSGVPSEVAEVFRREISAGRAPVLARNCAGAILGSLRMRRADELSCLAEMQGGLAERMLAAASEAVDLDAFYALAATKKYTDSRVRRAVLYALTGVIDEDLRRPAAYVNLLGATAAGRVFLASYRKKPSKRLEIVTRPAAILEDTEDAAWKRQVELQLRSEALYTLFYPSVGSAGRFLKERPRML